MYRCHPTLDRPDLLPTQLQDHQLTFWNLQNSFLLLLLNVRLYNSKTKTNHSINHLLSHSTHHQYFLYLLQNHLYQYVHFPPSYLCQKVRFLNIFDQVAYLLSLHCCCLVEMILRLDDPWHQPAGQSCLLHQLRSFHQVAFSHGWAEMLKPGQILFAKINISSDFFLSALIEESNNFRLFVQFCEFFI